MIAVDLGQSGCRISIEGKLHSTNRGKLAGESVLVALEENFKNIGASSELVTLSLTGLFGHVENAQAYLELCNKYFGAKEVAVIDDGLASLAGSLAGQPGVALTLGGGVVAVGGNGSALSHSDGLGSVFGDEGGGFWLGSRGLTRALAARDGRSNAPELLNIFAEELNAFDSLSSKNGTEATTLAISSAKKVLEANVDSTNQIVAKGAVHLAETVVSAWKKVGSINEPFKLTISGGLSKNDNYRKLIFDNIKSSGAKVELVEASGDNLDGAIWIALNQREDIAPMLGWARA
jgi:N-acetylglucosamine kinase-like BadF-type ATPase